MIIAQNKYDDGWACCFIYNNLKRASDVNWVPREPTTGSRSEINSELVGRVDQLEAIGAEPRWYQ